MRGALAVPMALVRAGMAIKIVVVNTEDMLTTVLLAFSSPGGRGGYLNKGS